MKILMLLLGIAFTTPSFAAIWKCSRTDVPTSDCPYGVEYCVGYGWCGPSCEITRCSPTPAKPKSAPFEMLTASSQEPPNDCFSQCLDEFVKLHRAGDPFRSCGAVCGYNPW